MNRFAGTLLLFIGATATAMASVVTPEIDASAGAAAVALLSGSLLVIRGRRRKQ